MSNRVRNQQLGDIIPAGDCVSTFTIVAISPAPQHLENSVLGSSASRWISIPSQAVGGLRYREAQAVPYCSSIVGPILMSPYERKC